ncbi:MAG: DUF2490 domain-containing protein [Ichthyobacteriaceae bacterium]|nr:DUF2490 domain-containing protein [Ichthyobacteriaceae bacterium]
MPLLVKAQLREVTEILENHIVTNQFWFDFNPSYSINKSVAVYADFAARTVYPQAFNRYSFGSSIKYKKPKFIFSSFSHSEELHFGLRNFYTNNFYSTDRFEFRVFQGYKLKSPLTTNLVWQNYLRLEERFDFDTENWNNTFAVRFRLYSMFKYTFNGNVWAGSKGTYLATSMELFWNLAETHQFNDLMRLTARIGRIVNPKWRYEFDLGYFLTRETVQDSFGTNDIVFRLRIYYKI